MSKKHTEAVRTLKYEMTMAIWDEALAVKAHNVMGIYLASLNRAKARNALEELAENWGEK